MPRTKTPAPDTTSSTTPRDPAGSFAAIRPRLDAMAADRITPPPSELRPALEAARALATALSDPAVIDRFARVPSDLLDPGRLAAFGDALRGFEYARGQLEAAASAQGEVTLPEELAARSNALRARMLKVVVHYFEDDETLASELRPLGRKKGHPALCADLRKLAELYDAQRAVVERDPKYWREGDSDEAREAAEAVEALLRAARGEAESEWGDAVARSWTLLAALHEELRLTAHWLFRDEGGAERFVAMPAPPRKRGPRGKGGVEPAA